MKANFEVPLIWYWKRQRSCIRERGGLKRHTNVLRSIWKRWVFMR